MTQVSKRWIQPDIWEYINQSLIYMIKDLDNVKDVQSFLISVLTETESLMIAKRIVTAFLLRNKTTTEEICEKLKLTRSTVVRLKILIKIHKKDFDILFEKMEKQNRRKITKDIFLNILNYALRASSGNVSAITRKKFKKGALY